MVTGEADSSFSKSHGNSKTKLWHSFSASQLQATYSPGLQACDDGNYRGDDGCTGDCRVAASDFYKHKVISTLVSTSKKCQHQYV